MQPPGQPFRTDYGALQRSIPFAVEIKSQRDAQNFYWATLRNSQQSINGLRAMALGSGGRFGDAIQVGNTDPAANDIATVISAITGQYAPVVASQSRAVAEGFAAQAAATQAVSTQKMLTLGLVVGGGVIALLGAIALLKR